MAVEANPDMGSREKGYHCVSWILGFWLPVASGERTKGSFALNLFQIQKVKLVS